MTATAAALTGLKRQRPEWGPWLGVVEEVVREKTTSTWQAAVPAFPEARQAKVPLLAGATIAVETSAVRRVLARLLRHASRSGTPEMATLASAVDADLDVVTLFEASLCQDSDRVEKVAADCRADAGALQAVVALVAVPLLHACNQTWACSIPVSWVEGYCPVCGGWPAFAEARGIERSRFFRCGRCGSEWHARLLNCPYCALDDHAALASLVPANAGAYGAIEACRRCLGYVKTFTRLQGCEPDTVMLEDLASVHLDVAAIEHGYARPPGPGYPLTVSVTGRNARRFFTWRS